MLAALSFKDVSFSYHDRKILNDISLSIASGGNIVSLVGPSGSGKTTIFKLALGEIHPNEGEISIAPNHVSVFQDFNRMILDWFNVEKNITFGAKDKVDQGYLSKILQFLAIKDLRHSFPRTLSGGEKQRMVFARALYYKPDLLLVDEPLSSVDQALLKGLISHLRDFLKTFKISVLWITHDIPEAIRLSDEILVLDPRKSLISFKVDPGDDPKHLLMEIQSAFI